MLQLKQYVVINVINSYIRTEMAWNFAADTSQYTNVIINAEGRYGIGIVGFNVPIDTL